MKARCSRRCFATARSTSSCTGREDKQKPHARDEVYAIATGPSRFVVDGRECEVAAGDVLFVPAHAEHRFIGFSDDFSTWVFFYGPEGGERGA